MMLMAMRLQKSQLPSSFKWTAGQAATFNRDPYLMAGYTNFDVMVVGASGGRSGLGSWPAQPGADKWYGSGGGGGSSKRVIGSLSDLAVSTAIAVGAQGANGADGVNAAPGSGSRGGNSSFGATAIGYGGYGGYGAASVSFGSMGGEGANPDGSKGPVGGYKLSGASSRAAATGTWDPVLKQGSGGGGGGGSNITYGSVTYSGQEQAGGGANSGDGYFAGGEAAQSSYYGGGGGGANINPYTGTGNEDYGSGYNHGRGGGVVALKVS